MPLNLGSVSFTVEARLAIADAERAVADAKARMATPVNIPVNMGGGGGGFGSGGGFGGGGGGGSGFPAPGGGGPTFGPGSTVSFGFGGGSAVGFGNVMGGAFGPVVGIGPYGAGGTPFSDSRTSSLQAMNDAWLASRQADAGRSSMMMAMEQRGFAAESNRIQNWAQGLQNEFTLSQASDQDRENMMLGIERRNARGTGGLAGRRQGFFAGGGFGRYVAIHMGFSAVGIAAGVADSSYRTDRDVAAAANSDERAAAEMAGYQRLTQTLDSFPFVGGVASFARPLYQRATLGYDENDLARSAGLSDKFAAAQQTVSETRRQQMFGMATSGFTGGNPFAAMVAANIMAPERIRAAGEPYRQRYLAESASERDRIAGLSHQDLIDEGNKYGLNYFNVEQNPGSLKVFRQKVIDAYDASRRGGEQDAVNKARQDESTIIEQENQVRMAMVAIQRRAVDIQTQYVQSLTAGASIQAEYNRTVNTAGLSLSEAVRQQMELAASGKGTPAQLAAAQANISSAGAAFGAAQQSAILDRADANRLLSARVQSSGMLAAGQSYGAQLSILAAARENAGVRALGQGRGSEAYQQYLQASNAYAQFVNDASFSNQQANTLQAGANNASFARLTYGGSYEARMAEAQATYDSDTDEVKRRYNRADPKQTTLYDDAMGRAASRLNNAQREAARDRDISLRHLQTQGLGIGYEQQAAEQFRRRDFNASATTQAIGAIMTAGNEDLIAIGAETDPALRQQMGANAVARLRLQQAQLRNRYVGGASETRDVYQAVAEGYRRTTGTENVGALNTTIDKLISAIMQVIPKLGGVGPIFTGN